MVGFVSVCDMNLKGISVVLVVLFDVNGYMCGVFIVLGVMGGFDVLIDGLVVMVLCYEVMLISVEFGYMG